MDVTGSELRRAVIILTAELVGPTNFDMGDTSWASEDRDRARGSLTPQAFCCSTKFGDRKDLV